MFFKISCEKYLNEPFISKEDEDAFKLDLNDYIKKDPFNIPGIELKEISKNSIWDFVFKNINIICFKGDITKLKVECIVNAANESLLGGGGVDYCIHQSAGPTLVKECATLGGCEVGSSKITKGYHLPSKTVIHTVGPLINNDDSLNPIDLKNCYISSLNICEKYSLKSIAFCCISCGFYGYPNKEASIVAFNSIIEYIQNNPKTSLKNIIFCIFDEEQQNCYQEVYNNFKK